MNNKQKLITFSILTSLMIGYIAWVFYISEPKYVDNCYKKLEKYDYVSIPSGAQYSFEKEAGIFDTENGLVLQVDSNKAIIKLADSRSKYMEVVSNKHGYRVIGKGTIYHKVNNLVGVDIMMISQVFIFVLLLILINSTFSLTKNFFD